MQMNDRELLARTLQAEAGNQGLPGMIAAGSVVMNRIGSGGYGGNLRDVILKPGQFSAWNSLTGYAGGEQGQDMTSMTPSAEAYKAADTLLAGGYEDPTGGATHYYNPAISQPSWGASAGGSWTEIGDHLFGQADAGRNPNQGVAADAMRAIGRQPRGILEPTQTAETETAPMMQEEQPRGLLEGLGIQRMEEGAEGETGQRFFQRDSFKDTAATLAQGFAALGSNPAVQKFAADVAGQRTEAKAKNKTIDYLRRSGRDDLADAVESGSLGARDAAGILFKQPKAQDPYSAIGKLQADLAAGRIDQSQYEAALQSMAPSGMAIEVGPDGGVRVTQGKGVSGGTPSERQSTLALFGGLMAETMPEISRLESSETFNPASLAEGVAAQTGWLGNYLRTEEGQRYQGLARQWAEGVLRIQTGAAATQPEIERVMETYFPVPGDTAETVRQKSEQRDAFARSLVKASGGNIAAPGGAGERPGIGADEAGPAPTNRIRYDAQGNRIND